MTFSSRSVRCNQRKFAILLSVAAVFAWTPGLAFQGGAALGPSSPVAAADEDYEKLYRNAIENAKIAKQSEISTDLLAVVPHPDPINYRKLNGHEIRWDDKKERVLVATLTDSNTFENIYKKHLGQDYNLTKSVWVTVVPELSTRFIGQPCPPSEMRLKQLYGINPTRDFDALVEMWVDPSELFRPTPDPEITDHEAELAVQIGETVFWTLPAQAQRFVEIDYFDYVVGGYPFTVGPLPFPDWYDNETATSYNLSGRIDTWGAPWTRLGYTYDWGNPDDHKGLSEFKVNLDADTQSLNVTLGRGFTSEDPEWNAYFLCGPAAPSLTASAETGRVDLTWQSVPGADGYLLLYSEVERGASFEPPFPADDRHRIDLGDVTWFSAAVESDTTYYAAIQAHSGANSGALSNIVYLYVP